MKLNRNTILGALVIIAIIVVVILLLTRRRVKGGTTGYRFFRHTDSPGGDVGYHPDLAGNVKALKEKCNEHPDCIAFNTDGRLKKAILPPHKLVEKSGYPDWYGIYIHPQVLR